MAGTLPEAFPTAEARRAVDLQFVDILVRIHAADWQAGGLDFLGGAGSAEAVALAQVERWAEYHARSQLFELPLIRHEIAWLRANRSPSGRVALCHSDYLIGNFMVRDGSIIGVFDWEFAHGSDWLRRSPGVA